MRNKIFILLAVFQVFLVASCSKINETIPNSLDQENFVSLADAKSLVSAIQAESNSFRSQIQQSTKGNSSISRGKSIQSVKSVPDDSGKDAFHIINFKEDGFIIISGDNRAAPVLAFSDNTTFSLDAETYPSGLVEWLISAKQHVEKLREEGGVQSEVAASAWEAGSIISPP